MCFVEFFLLLNLKSVKEILLDYHTENNLIVCPLHTSECNSGEELIDTCIKTFRHEKKEHNVTFICSLHYLQSSVHRFSYMKYQRCFLCAPCLNQKDLQSYLSKAFDQD